MYSVSLAVSSRTGHGFSGDVAPAVGGMTTAVRADELTPPPYAAGPRAPPTRSVPGTAPARAVGVVRLGTPGPVLRRHLRWRSGPVPPRRPTPRLPARRRRPSAWSRAARRAPGVLRRCRPGRGRGGEGPRAARRPGVRAQADRPQQARRRDAGTARGDLRRRHRRGAGRGHRRLLRTPWGARRPRGGGAPPAADDRRDLPAGDQGPQGGRPVRDQRP